MLSTHSYATIHLPTKDGTVHRLRKPGRPEACQSIGYQSWSWRKDEDYYYVHLHRQPVIEAVCLHRIVDLPRRAVVLNTGRELPVDVAELPSLHQQTPNRCLRLRKLPVNRQSLVGWVIRLEFDGLSATGG